MSIKRLFIERKGATAGIAVANEIKNVLGINARVRLFLRYDIEGIDVQDFEKAVNLVFSTPAVDDVYYESLPDVAGEVFGIEYLPGQFDQRADSAAQCVQLLTGKEQPVILCADIYALQCENQNQLEKIKKYLINPVESRECCLKKPDSLKIKQPEPDDIVVIDDFINADNQWLKQFHSENSFAMSLEDLAFVQQYFKNEKRNPTLTEIKVIDTYWSDHCRHTTFLTHLKDIKIQSGNPHIQSAYKRYLQLFAKHNADRKDKYPSLMDIATIGTKELKSQGFCKNIEISPEINACSIEVPVDVNGKNQDYLVMFKNETHNHPTEIEPFGGAATCLGGAIRDPLSGRSYVYHAMRVTGAGDINAPIEKTLKGKLPQRVISKTAAKGFSSYGNQIGLATGLVKEFYHHNYTAKRLETGFVVGAALKSAVKRLEPCEGDLVLLIGGATGRDGCGGATGSSKSHDISSIDTCGAEVQKGNAPVERKLQRLFKNDDVKKLIKRCNDFGAGGVSVAVGELAAGLDIDLNAVPKKYTGLSATELAISESQERMAVVIDKTDYQKMLDFCNHENIDMTVIAKVSSSGVMRMFYDGKAVVDLKREFLDTNGVKQSANPLIKENTTDYFNTLSSSREQLFDKGDYSMLITDILSDCNVCSQKGMGEMFDSTIGAGTVLMPFGGKDQMTPSMAMAAKIPVDVGSTTNTCTVASYGFNPHLMTESPFVGAMYSVLLSVLKVAASGVNTDTIYLSLQEFFGKCKSDEKWGKPLSALLGALTCQLELNIAAIGGKDSMSGSFENLDVPPTLISFAIGTANAKGLICNTLKSAQKSVYRYSLKRDIYGIPDFKELNGFLKLLNTQIKNGNVDYSAIVEYGGAAAEVVKSCLGNGLGFNFNKIDKNYFTAKLGDILFCANDISGFNEYKIELIGTTINDKEFRFNAALTAANSNRDKISGQQVLPLNTALKAFTQTFEDVYPTKTDNRLNVENLFYDKPLRKFPAIKSSKPKVFIPVFPGTNCEYDSAKRFVLAGGQVSSFVIKNRSASDISESIDEVSKLIKQSQIIMFPGGFSGGDEPDGSAKLIASFFCHPKIKDAVEELLQCRDGLILGICNGFQALVKLGLLPFGQILPSSCDSPVLTFNEIGRHISQVCKTRVSSTLSPWFSNVKAGEIYNVALSHGEGKFVCSEQLLNQMRNDGRIATQYCDHDGNASMQTPFNPNGSVMAIEALTSCDGRILGKMGHSERIGENLMKNVTDVSTDMKIFEAGINYFK